MCQACRADQGGQQRNLIKYWLEDTLNKRIKTRLKDLGKLIKEKDYALTYIDPKKHPLN